MKTLWKDIVEIALAIVGGVVVYGRLQDYNWWLIGSWKGALATLAVIGLGIMLTNVADLIEVADAMAMLELGLWLITATVVISSLVVTTTQAEFVWSAILIGVSWATQLARNIWLETHHRPHRLVAVH